MSEDLYNYEEDDAFVMEECVDDATAYSQSEYEMMLVGESGIFAILVQHEQLGVVEGMTFDEMGKPVRWGKKDG